MEFAVILCYNWGGKHRRCDMLGALIGDVVGSQYEFQNFKSKKFTLFTKNCRATDDSFMTLAIAEALVICRGDESVLAEVTERCMRKIAQKHKDAGWGYYFYKGAYDALK